MKEDPDATNTGLKRTWRNNLYSAWDIGWIMLDQIYSTWRSKFSLWLQGCPYGDGLGTTGSCSFKAKKSGSIRFGNKVRLQAGWRSNRVGLTNQVLLQTLDDGIIRIGNNSGGSSLVLSAMNSIIIGDGVRIGGNVRVYDHDFHSLDMVERTTLPLHLQDIRNAPIVIGNGVFIGTGAMVLKGSTIGENAIVGAGAVVSGNIPPAEIWAGNPARFVKQIPSAPSSQPSKL